MATPDASNVLAYLDAGDLLELVDTDEHWPLFEASLLPRTRWRGSVETLRDLRNRHAHCRRPHPDDLSRVEQVLRDLERGARIALEAHNRRSWFQQTAGDSIAAGWLRKEHPSAMRLVDHCEQQYDTRLQLEWSRRPWASAPTDDAVAGTEGVFVHATFHLGMGYIRPVSFWPEFVQPGSMLDEMLVYLVMDFPASPSFTFAAIDGTERVNDAIGGAFDAVITGMERGHLDLDDAAYDRWIAESRHLDSRVQVNTALSAAYPDQPFSVFRAG